SSPVTAMQVYVDGTLKQTFKASTLDMFVALAVGNHTITVKGWDSSGSFKTDVPVAMQPPCALGGTNTVTICSLANGAIVSQPFHVVAAVNDNNPVTSMTLFIDGVGKGGISNSAILDMYVSNLPLGTHKIGVQANDSSGFVAKAPPITVTVTDRTQG